MFLNLFKLGRYLACGLAWAQKQFREKLKKYVVELEEWNPSNGPQERSDSEPADSNVVATISVGSSLAGKSLDQQPETAKSLGSIEDVVKALAAEDEASEAIVSAKVSVESTDNKSRVTHKGTVEDLAVN